MKWISRAGDSAEAFPKAAYPPGKADSPSGAGEIGYQVQLVVVFQRGILPHLPFTPANITSPGPAAPLAMCPPARGATRRVPGHRA